MRVCGFASVGLAFLAAVLGAGQARAQLPAAAPAQPSTAVPQPLLPAQRNPIELQAPVVPPALSAPIEGPPIAPQTGPGAAATVRVGTVRLSGNTALPDAALARATGDLAGQTIPLARIEEARLDILRAYRAGGYPFAAVNAGLRREPDGTATLTFAVVEGFVAEVRLEGDIGPAGTQVLRFLNRLVGQRPVSDRAIERALLLASDIPGVTVRGTLRPLASEPGALQLVAQVERRAVSGYVNIDNRGYRLVGPWQGLFVAGLNSVTEFGERTELSLFGAQESTQWFAQGSVESFVGGSGLRVRLYGGAGETRPSGTLRALGYFGETTVAGIGATYPILRSRPANLFAVTSLDLFESTIETGTSGRTRASRDYIRTYRVGLDGQLLEGWLPVLPVATSIASVRLHQGINGLGATRNRDPGAGRTGTEFDFLKVTGEVQRTQPLFAPWDGAMINLQGVIGAQWSDAILPQAEKFYLGGARLGRGFYAGQVTGDKAWAFGVEIQLDTGLDLPIEPALGSNRVATQFYFFRDFGRAYQNLATDPDRRLSSWGGGVRLVLSDAVQFDIEGVHRETRRPEGLAADRLRDTALLFRTLVRF